MNSAFRSSFRLAVVENTASVLRISPESWPWRSESAPKTSAPLETSPVTACSWLSRMRSASSASAANESSEEIAIPRSSPRPRRAAAAPCIHWLNAALVRASKVRKISSSWTESETCARGRSPPSGSGSASLLPGLSST